MSKYTTVTTKFSDVKVLCSALEEMGFSPEVHETAVHLYDYRGYNRPDLAEIVIPRAQVGFAANDIGFKRQANGNYTAIISEYDLGAHGAKWQGELARRYQTINAKKLASRAGLRCIGSKIVNGAVELQFLQA